MAEKIKEPAGDNQAGQTGNERLQVSSHIPQSSSGKGGALADSARRNGEWYPVDALPDYQISEHDRKSIDRYKTYLVPTGKIQPSPENSEVYGAINAKTDPALPMLVRSIRRLGLEEPLILTRDNFILSGHRRFVVLQAIGAKVIPVRYANVTRADATDYHRLLAQYNPQRVKSVASLISEKLLQTDKANYKHSWTKYHQKRSNKKIGAMRVPGSKSFENIGDRQQEFLNAVIEIIENMENYWPLSVRQIHYKLLNKPPLTQTTKNMNEKWRYRNDLASYNKLSNLLVSARYEGSVDWSCIDDSTRQSRTFDDGYQDLSEFIDAEVEGFMDSYRYRRHRLEGQPNHVEVLLEKNTLVNICQDICKNFGVAFTPLRGYGGPSVWHEIEERWREKVDTHDGPIDPKCILIIVSDHDPEGLDLADDAVRSLRDNHEVEVEAIRPAVTLEQVRQFNLHPNNAKESSARFPKYVERTGTRQSWECEALDPEVIRTSLHKAILSVLDTKQLDAVQERECEEKDQLRTITKRLGTKLQEIVEEEGF